LFTPPIADTPAARRRLSRGAASRHAFRRRYGMPAIRRFRRPYAADAAEFFVIVIDIFTIDIIDITLIDTPILPPLYFSAADSSAAISPLAAIFTLLNNSTPRRRRQIFAGWLAIRHMIDRRLFADSAIFIAARCHRYLIDSFQPTADFLV
jgi:hypothetical protein